MSVYPSFYDPQQVGKRYQPNIALAMAEGDQVNWRPALRDKTGERVALFVVDMQDDFVFPDGNLSVPGAVDDVRRLVELIYRVGSRITTIAPTMDTHYPFMIFFPSWWVDKAGKHPEPFTIISQQEVEKGIWRAVVDPVRSHQYVIELAKKGKYSLMIWPYHCLETTPGINLVPALSEAIAFHAAARKAQPVVLRKGNIPFSEFYSPLRPEVDVPDVPGGTINTNFLSLLSSHDLILVAGEAKSHCVLAAMETLVEYFSQSQPEVLGRIQFLEDCTSSVVHPQVDFEAIANNRLQQMSGQYGFRLVKSTEISL